MPIWKRAWRTARRTVVEFLADDPFVLAAATSYYTLLSLAPLLLIVVSVAGLAFEREAVEGRIVEEIRGLVGTAGAEAIQTIILHSSGPKSNVSIVIGIGTLLLGASTVFVQLQTALNKIWDVSAEPQRKGRILVFLRRRLTSVAMVFGIGFLLLVSLVVSAGLTALAQWLRGPEEELAVVWRVVHELVSLIVVALLFAMMFKFLPDRRIPWRNVWTGALITAALFAAGKQLIGMYLGRASIGSSFGAAGSVVVLTVWVYYAALIVFLGAEITKVHSDRASTPAPPVEFASSEAR
jgi:membrane protein